MTRRAFVDVGTRVARKRDGALGTITNRTAVISRPFGARTTLLHVRLDDAAERARVGGDMVGDLGWFASYFRAVQLTCDRCGSPKPADQSCGCFDNGCQ